ncbi:MAG: dihydrodipicolinate synthase family protein, partial [Planctomycetota bacterium]|nr:dihydrodipicolinate synthase family protein [Planctomycetota bacterium]
MFAKTEGLIAAPFTPMLPDGGLHLAAIPAYADFLRRNGMIGVFVNGTTGEGQSLTTAERKAVADAWVAAAKGLKVFVHVGHVSLAEAQDLAQHAQSVGAFAIAACAPYFFKPASASALAQALAPIAAAAPNLPFYYYHIPAMTGVDVPVAAFLQAAAQSIPNLAGAKFTYENLLDFQLCLRAEGGRFDMLFGRDEFLLAGLALGAQGGVGSTYNFAAPLYVEIIAACKRGDFAAARDLQ